MHADELVRPTELQMPHFELAQHPRSHGVRLPTKHQRPGNGLVARVIDRRVLEMHAAAAVLPREAALWEIGVGHSQIADGVDVGAEPVALHADAAGHPGNPIAPGKLDGVLRVQKERDEEERKNPRHYAATSTRSAIANFSASMPCPVALEISKKGRPRSSATWRSAATRSGSCAASSFVATTIMGFAASSSLKLASSCITISKSWTGSRRLPSETSTKCASRRVRSIWRRNWMPSPAPSCAPSISPGISA